MMTDRQKFENILSASKLSNDDKDWLRAYVECRISLPEARNVDLICGTTQTAFNKGFNACLDQVKELNKKAH